MGSCRQCIPQGTNEVVYVINDILVSSVQILIFDSFKIGIVIVLERPQFWIMARITKTPVFR